jgi:hypothetical protein
MSNVRSIAAETASAIVERLIGQRPRVRRRARRHRQKLKRQFTPNFRSQISDQLAE